MVLIQCQVSSQRPSPPSLLLSPFSLCLPPLFLGLTKERGKQKGMDCNLLRCAPHGLTSSWNCLPEELLLLHPSGVLCKATSYSQLSPLLNLVLPGLLFSSSREATLGSSFPDNWQLLCTLTFLSSYSILSSHPVHSVHRTLLSSPPLSLSIQC